MGEQLGILRIYHLQLVAKLGRFFCSPANYTIIAVPIVADIPLFSQGPNT